MTVGDGLVRLRVNQIGKQTVFGTAVPATRRVAWDGLVEYDPGRTQPDVNEGSIDPVQAPISGVPDISWTPTGPMTYNDLGHRINAGVKGGLTSTGGGSTKTTTAQIASLTADPFSYYTVESGDDQSATDGIQAYGGVIDTWSEEMNDNLDVINFSDTWILAAANLATDRTAGLTLESAPVYVRGDETLLAIDVAPGSMGISTVLDALHAYSLTISNNLDRKKFANGSNSRRKLSGYARGARVIELVLTFAKTAATMSEENTADDEPAPNRFIRLTNVSATSPYSYIREGAFRLFSVTNGEIGGNATKVMTYRAYYDSTLGYAFKATVINTSAV